MSGPGGPSRSYREPQGEQDPENGQQHDLDPLQSDVDQVLARVRRGSSGQDLASPPVQPGPEHTLEARCLQEGDCRPVLCRGVPGRLHLQGSAGALPPSHECVACGPVNWCARLRRSSTRRTYLPRDRSSPLNARFFVETLPGHGAPSGGPGGAREAQPDRSGYRAGHPAPPNDSSSPTSTFPYPGRNNPKPGKP